MRYRDILFQGLGKEVFNIRCCFNDIINLLVFAHSICRSHFSVFSPAGIVPDVFDLLFHPACCCGGVCVGETRPLSADVSLDIHLAIPPSYRP